jgi:hypothetical protein
MVIVNSFVKLPEGKWAFSKPRLITGGDRRVHLNTMNRVLESKDGGFSSVWQEMYTWKISDGTPPTRLQTAAHLFWILP